MRKRYQFQRLNNQSKKTLGQWIMIESSPNQVGVTRLGITVTKRYGKSHERNRFKRMVREAYRLSYRELPVGLDLIVKPRAYAKKASSCVIQKELIQLLLESP